MIWRLFSRHYVSGPLLFEHENARFAGYLNCLEMNSISPDSSLLMFGDYLSEAGYKSVNQALNAGIKFDAVQASNYQAAISVLKVLQ